VFTATPWEWHVPVLLAAMKSGKHAVTEVPAAMNGRRLLAARRHGRAAQEALRDDGELLLRSTARCSRCISSGSACWASCCTASAVSA